MVLATFAKPFVPVVNADEGVVWVCPNWGSQPTTPSNNPADPTSCVYRGTVQDGAVPQNWFADTEGGRQDYPTTLSVSQITLRPTDPAVTSVIAAGSQPVTVAPPIVEQAAPISSNGCLIYNDMQTTVIDGGCLYQGPLVVGGFVPEGWKVYTGSPPVWYFYGRIPVDFIQASFYRQN